MTIQYNGWESFSCFFSAEYCQKFLKKCYQKNHVEEADQKSYENSYAFLYYLEHGQIYYQQAAAAPLIIKPILLFYGLVHLIKACILTRDPAYPETTAVLAHGVSTRKRKKQNYLFFHDEVKIQKSGLFPFMSEKLFHMKQLEGEKIIMEELLQLIPELNDLFMIIFGKKSVEELPMMDEHLMIPETILDHYHMTENRMRDFLTAKFERCIEFADGDRLRFQVKDRQLSEVSPIKYNLETRSWTLPLHKNRLLAYPELLNHYLLLYNLSMIARYETEWWSELTKMMPTHDYPFINSFLAITQEKGPFLVHQYLTRS